MNKIIVLTGTIDVSYGNANVAVSNLNERLNQYLQNIERFILKSDFDIIIFAENSNYGYNYLPLNKLAKKHNKKLEILSFMGSNDIIKIFGKGFGEGEILKYAVENSEYLKDNDVEFYKITGRIFVKNINKILKQSTAKNIFIKWDIRKNQIDSRFFKTQVGFFKKYVMPAMHITDERTALSIEEVYYSELRGNKEIKSFKSYPLITGICASLGKPYDLNFFKLQYRRLQLFFGALDVATKGLKSK